MMLNQPDRAGAPIFMLGFFVSATGDRRFDRYRLNLHGDAWEGEVLRLTSGHSGSEQLAATGRSEDGRFRIDLRASGSAARQCVRVGPAGGGGDSTYSGHLAHGTDRTCDTPYILEHAPLVRLDPSPTHGWGTVAADAVPRGRDVLDIRGPFSDTQTAYSFRAGADRHVEPTGYGHFVNHACDPSCTIVYRKDGRPVLVARRDLPAGAEITFDYTSTEGRLAHRFACLCPAPVHKV